MPHFASLNDKEYLGDGVYMAHDDYQIWIALYDGINYTNAIALEPGLIDKLKAYEKRMIEKA